MLHLPIEKIIDGETVESQRLDYKTGWNPDDILHTIVAFATDFHNEGGGYLIIGIEEKDGIPVRPVKGLIKNKIDGYQKQYLNLINRIYPAYTPSIFVEQIDDKYVIVIKCHQGEARPYDCPVSLSKLKTERAVYIRKGSNTVKVKSQSDKSRVEDLRNNIPFDERRCHSAGIDDIEINLIIEYLKNISSPLLEDNELTNDKYKLLECLELTCHPKESYAIKNAAILMFCPEPHIFFKPAKVDIVRFIGSGSKEFIEKEIVGPIYKIIEGSLRYFKTEIIHFITEKSDVRGFSIRYRNYPYIAIREVISNALYHQGYQQHRNVEIQIHGDRIEVLSYPGPLPPITNSDLLDGRVSARDYRNVKIGELLKDYGLTEKRATGIPTIRRSLSDNGSPPPQFEMDDNDRTYFKAVLHVHPKFLSNNETEVVTDILDDKKQVILEFCLDNSEKLVSIKRNIEYEDIEVIIQNLIDEGLLVKKRGRYQTTDNGKNKLFTSY